MRAAARPGRERNAPHTRISQINLTEIIIMAQRMSSKRSTVWDLEKFLPIRNNDGIIA